MADEKNSLDEVRRKTTGTAIGLAGAGGTGVGKKAGQPQTREESNNDPNTGTNAQRKGSLGSPSTVFGGMAAAGALGGAGNSNLFNRNAAVAADMNRDNAGGQTSGQIGRNNDAPSGVSDAALGGPENNNKSNNPLANRRKVGSPTGGN
jgi:hypothetical protein